MFCFYKRRCRDNFHAECAISHCRKGMRALPAKEDSNYLTPMPLDNQCCMVWDGQCVDTKSKDRVSFCKLLESSLTPKIGDVILEPDVEWMNNN